MKRVAWISALVLLASCLPKDTRPPPGVVVVSVEPAATITTGFTTSDGWRISFERVLLGLGTVALGGGVENTACQPYADALFDNGYERLFDLAAAKDPQKVAEVFALDTCDLSFRLRSPRQGALLGAGVTSADLTFMQAPHPDSYILYGGTAAFVRGQASRGAVTKRFSWPFSVGWSFHDCGRDAAGMDAIPAGRFDIHGGDVINATIVVHGEELFRENVDADAAIRFDALADADTDGDQEISMEELAKVPAPPLDVDAGVLGSGDGGAPSLADLITLALVPRMIEIGPSGTCQADRRPRR